MDLKALGSFEMGPNIPGVASDEGRGFVLATCMSDDGDQRLAGRSRFMKGRPFFSNFNAAS